MTQLAPPGSDDPAPDRRILFFGDSFVAGVGDPTGLGWVGRVTAAAWAAGMPVTTYNLGVRRDTSRDVAARWQTEAAARHADAARIGVVFAFGANDVACAEGVPRVAQADSLAALTRVLDAADGLGLATFVVGPLVVADDPGHATRAAALEAGFAAICAQRRVPLATVVEAVSRSPSWRAEALGFDGAHPGRAGYAQVADLVLGAGWLGWVRALGGAPRADAAANDE